MTIRIFVLKFLEVINQPSPDKHNLTAREAERQLSKGMLQVTAQFLGLRQFTSIGRGHIMLVGNSRNAWRYSTKWQRMEGRGEVQGPGNHKVVPHTFDCHGSLQNTFAISSPVTEKKIIERTQYIKLKKCSTHRCVKYQFFLLKSIFFQL